MGKKNKSFRWKFFECTLCNKNFNGNVPYDDHLRSKKHKTKSLLQQTREAIGNRRIAKPSDSFILPQGVGYYCTFWCSLCKLELNGLLRADIHAIQDGHLKLKLEHEKNRKNQVVKRRSH